MTKFFSEQIEAKSDPAGGDVIKVDLVKGPAGVGLSLAGNKEG